MKVACQAIIIACIACTAEIENGGICRDEIHIVEKELSFMDKRFVYVLTVAAAVIVAVPMTDVLAADTVVEAAVAKKPGKKLAEVLFSVDMHCAKCVEKITGNIAFEKGVKDLKVSLDRRTVWIKYDPSKTDEAALKAALESLGYKVRKTAGE